MEMDFSDKVVLVTGASAGIGESTALLFAQYGAKLALVGTNETNLRDVAARCQQYKGLTPLAIIADLSTDEGSQATANATLKHFGRVDVLVNNASIGAKTTIETTDMASFDRVFNLDVRGVYNLTRLLVPALIETKGNIINISSVVATIVAIGSLPYSMAKISKFVQRMTGISDAEYAQYLKSAEQLIPMGTVCGGDDIARMVLFVASDLCPLVTGTIIPVDGGMRYGNPRPLMKRE